MGLGCYGKIPDYNQMHSFQILTNKCPNNSAFNGGKTWVGWKVHPEAELVASDYIRDYKFTYHSSFAVTTKRVLQNGKFLLDKMGHKRQVS